MKRQTAALVATTALAAVLAGPLAAQSQGDWTLGVGLGWVNPKSNNGTLAGLKAEVGDNIRPTFTAEYFFRDNWGIEILAATPFEHNVFLGGSYAAKVKQLPPTVSVNYHIPTQTAFKPFVGLGLNYTTFFDESMAGGGKLSLDDSWGVAVHAGVDYQITDRGAMRFDLRWIDINTDASLNGVNIGSADINPLVVGVSYVHRF